ncbi:transposase [Elysia marginata]|uniref:Transposase n=1 Tax=Elysia marginata TaxID=1093978 RepID=A0AAV4G6K0_9GAST|nr:transposase [Elysia marginata]
MFEPHGPKRLSDIVTELGIQVLPHPACSPDLALCDFWLFPILKDRLAGQNFDRIQDLAKALNSELRTKPEEEFQGVFRKRQIRLKLAEPPINEGWRFPPGLGLAPDIPEQNDLVVGTDDTSCRLAFWVAALALPCAPNVRSQLASAPQSVPSAQCSELLAEHAEHQQRP